MSGSSFMDDGASGSDSSQITVTSVPVTVAILSVTEWGMLLLDSILAIVITFRLRKSGGSIGAVTSIQRMPFLKV